MLPIGLVFALFAEPLIDTAFGSEYGGAVAPLQVLAPMTVLWGINGVISAVLIGRDRPRIYTVPAAISLGLSLVLSLLLMPSYGAVGAATMVPSTLLLAALTIRGTTRLVGGIWPLRIVVTPVVAGGAMVMAVVLLAGAPWALSAGLATIAYGIAFMAIERVFFPNDFAYYSRIARFGTGPGPHSDPETLASELGSPSLPIEGHTEDGMGR